MSDERPRPEPPPTVAETSTAPPTDLPRTETASAAPRATGAIGPYTLLEKLGEGGMGIVYRAEQRAPVRRQVALKVIKLGMDTKEVVARFEAERQALAVMDHPNIARVFEAGATPEGRPYFVMELVRGVPIVEYCDRHNLSTDGRLELFVRVCEAVQHAHQKGVIHRDLKPSNVLVSIVEGRPLPKIIDFGVAKATGRSLSEKTMFTAMGQLIGTPEYMSPEQAELSGLDVDTRTDIYSLGVILYELLTGELPFDSRTLRSAPFTEMQRIIREQEPSKPSARFTALGERNREVARHHATDVRSLRRELRGDLDWIVMRAIEKDRIRRYDTAKGLARDIERHLAHQPIEARPPSATYRLRKFVRRNRLGVAVGGALALTLLVGIVTTIWGRIAVGREAARTEAEAARTAALSDFFLGEVFNQARPEIARGREVTVREALDTAAAAVGDRLADQPALEADVRYKAGELYRLLGAYDESTSQLERSLELYEGLYGTDDERTIKARNELGLYYLELHRYRDAEKHFRALLPSARRTWGEEARDTLTLRFNIASALLGQKRYEEAEPELKSVLEDRRRLLGPDHAQTISAMANLAFLHTEIGRFDEAEPYQRAVVDFRRRTLGEDDPKTLVAMHNLGRCYWKASRYEQAEQPCRTALAGFRRLYGEDTDHAYTLEAMRVLAAVIVGLDKLEEAETLAGRAYEGHVRLYGAAHDETRKVASVLVSLHEKRGDRGSAERWRARASAAKH